MDFPIRNGGSVQFVFGRFTRGSTEVNPSNKSATPALPSPAKFIALPPDPAGERSGTWP